MEIQLRHQPSFAVARVTPLVRVQVRGIENPLISSRVHGMPLLPGGEWFSEAGVEQLPATQAGKEPETALCYPRGWRVLKSGLESSLVQRLVDVARQ